MSTQTAILLGVLVGVLVMMTVMLSVTVRFISSEPENFRRWLDRHDV